MESESIRTEVTYYLSNHLDAVFWTALSEENKSALLQMATLDIASAVPALRIEDLPNVEDSPARPGQSDFFIAAVAEQALYLAHTYDAQKEGRVIQSQSVGDLSQTYKYLTDASSGSIGPRAAAFVKRLRSCTGRVLRFDRG